MEDTCGKENTVCAVVECCPGFQCQQFEGGPLDTDDGVGDVCHA